ncbi:hypothetical protein C8R45DRAFT_86143 [Mycena sanguinolenta]|nr:hypothetical protein C8R45DRAFT_86143 [Mycena sanguinolenta]
MQQTQAHIYGGIGGNGGAAGGQGGAGGAGQGPTTNFGGLQFVVQSNNQPDAQRLLTIDTSPTGGGCLTGGASSQPCVSSPAAISEPNTPRASYSRSATYCRHLLGQGRGFPLYVPGPQSNLPREYRTTGVSIGDAGRVTPEGIFDFLFNIFLPRDHPVNARAPHDFTPLAPYDPSDLCTVDFAPGDHVSGLSATETSNEAMGFPGGDFIFTCFDPDGAILCLPHGAHLVRLQDVEAIRRYAAKNAESWYQYANVVRGRGIVNGELYLITGCEKASSWGIATFHGVPLQTTFSLSFRPTRDERPGFRYRWQGPHSHRKQVDTSPADGTPPNQTVFIHAFTISVAERIWEKLFGVEVRQLVDSSTLLDKLGRPFVPYGSSGSSFFQSSFFGVFGGGKQNGQGPALCDGLVADASPVSKISHPSHIIHSCILRKAPEATVVITHDDDWRDFLKADYMRKSAQRWEEALFDHLEIMVQDGMAFLKDKSTSKRGATTMTAETIRDCPVSSPDDLPSLLPHSNRRSESGGERSANISLSSMPQSPAGIGPDLQDRSQDFLFPGGMPSSRSCSQFSLLTGVQVPVPTPGLDDSILALNNRSRSDSDLSTQCKDIRSGSSLPKEEGSDGALRLRHAHHSDDEHVGTDSTEISHRSFGRPHKPGLLRSASVRATTSANTYLKSIGSQQGRRTPMTEPPIPPATASWVIRPDELENVAHLSGLIAQGRWRNTVVILKVLSKQVEPSSLHQRGELWTSLRHPNVLQMFGVSPLDADPLYVVTQFQPDGNVMRFLERNPNVDRAKIKGL